MIADRLQEADACNAGVACAALAALAATQAVLTAVIGDLANLVGCTLPLRMHF